MADPLSAADIEVFLDRLRATIIAAAEGEAVRAALLELLGGPAPSPAPARAPRQRRAAAAKVARSSRSAPAPVAVAAAPKKRRQRHAVVTADAVLGVLRAARGGLAIRDFKAALGGGDETIRRRLHALEQAGAVTRTGHLATTRYHAA